MARTFVLGSSEYGEYVGAPATGFPLTVACWFRPAVDTARMCLVSIGNSANGHSFYLEAAGDRPTDSVIWNALGSATGSAETSHALGGGWTLNNWAHACGVETSNTSRQAFVNGGSAGSNPTNVTPSGINTTDIGARFTTARDRFYSGRIAEVGIWVAALNAREVAALAAGISPLQVRSGDLVAYWPLWGLGSPEQDLTRFNRPLTLTGTVASNHAPTAPISFLDATSWWSEELPVTPGRTGRMTLLGVGR